MTKRHFIALADAIREHNRLAGTPVSEIAAYTPFDREQLNTLADFCRAQNPNFNRERWLDYIAGKCGPNGGEK